MGGSRIFDWGGPHIDEARDAGQNVTISALKSWPIGVGAMALWPPPPGTAHAALGYYFDAEFLHRISVLISDVIQF